nr:MAG TPA: hypothetical protein [Caudoviricetes sp.]
MARATKIKDIHILRRNGRWTAVWQNHNHNYRVVRHADTPENALISLLASEYIEPVNRRAILSHIKFSAWLEQTGLIDLRRRLLFTKGRGWTDATVLEAVRIYREWRREYAE